MEAQSSKDSQIDINFESHPPIADDLNGIATLLRQSLLQFVDCHSLAAYLISLKDSTQVIAQESPDEDNDSDDEDADNDIYGVVSVVDLPLTTDNSSKDKSQSNGAQEQLLKFLKEKCPKFKETFQEAGDDNSYKYGMIVSERYINLPPQLALPTFEALTQTLDESKYTHLIFVSKILLKARGDNTKLPSKKSKTTGKQRLVAQDEPLVYVNPEEEIIFEKCDFYNDIDVSAHCDENATWSFSSDVKYIPHRRIFVVDYKKWPEILRSLKEELK